MKVVQKWKLLCNFKLRLKLLSFRKSKENFDFRSLIRNFASDKRLLITMTEMKVTLVERLTHRMAAASQHTETPLTEQQVQQLLEKMLGALTADEQQLVTAAADAAVKDAAMNQRPEVTEIRPKELECDVVRFQNNKDK